MEELLPYYERELSFLRRYSVDFALRYPKIAARLAPQGEHAEDPHVERMIEAFALLSARIGKKLDDNYPEFIEALVEVLYPHYLRPFPSCSIAQLTPTGLSAEAPLVRIARGAELLSRPIRGVPCRFRCAHDVTLAPLAVVEARYRSLATVPAAVALPPNASGIVSITLETSLPGLTFDALGLDALRIHLHGEQSFVAALADCLLIHATTAWVEGERGAYWHPLADVPLAQAGFGEDDALLDYPARSHPGYRLLAEYFAFAEKFDFFDLDLAALARTAGPTRRLTLHLAIKEVRDDSNTGRLLELLSAHHLRLFCTPVVNLFQRHGEPVLVDHEAVSYPVIADARHAFAYEVYSIDRVRLIRQQADAETVSEFRPFYALHHGEARHAGHYWYARRNDWVARNSPGYETEISVVDIDFEPGTPQRHTLSLELSCTNRDLPARLSVGLEGGDLFFAGDEAAGRVEQIALLRRPTPAARFARGHAAHWRLISHLALNHVSLTEGGAAALKEILTLYDMRRSPVSSRHIEGIVDIASRDAVQWLPGKPFATFVRGLEVRLTLDEEHFVGASLGTFVRVLDAFFGLYVHLNSFVQLVAVTKRNGEEIMRCKPRSGESILT